MSEQNLALRSLRLTMRIECFNLSGDEELSVIGPDPLSDSIGRSDHLLQEASDVRFLWSAPLVSLST